MKFTPHELAERRMELAAEYARDTEILAEILTRKPLVWKEIRSTLESDKRADQEWNATTDGIHEMQLRLKLKATEKKISAAKTMLDVLSAEARNII